MKFNEYQYERINIEEVKQMINHNIDVMNHTATYEEFKKAFDTISSCFAHVDTMESLMYVRNTVNTNDTFYDEERAFWDEHGPLIQEAKTLVYQCVLASSFLSGLEKEVPATYFQMAKNALQCFDPIIIGDLQEENRLTSAYQKLIASAQIDFDGEVYTLASIGVKMEDDDRDIRKAAMQAYWGWMEQHEEEIDTIFDQLVHLRDKMAKSLGFTNYIEMGYKLMNRLDYTQEDVSNYRKQVLQDVVVVANDLFKRQQERLGYDRLACYDLGYEFTSGNPTPKAKGKELIALATQMYHELSEETGTFFDFMVDHELLDLEAKPGKAGGGYCTAFPEYRSPFIFANFNGTSDDIDTLTHEAGHALQMYASMDIRPIECVSPTFESCEIHSMSMEFFTWPWMSNFFKEDVDKYYYLHLGGAIKFIPYGILVDHFQHVVYENVEMTPAERKQAWRELEKQYCPWKQFDELPFLEKGTWWMRQSHIFTSPFYYIDYTLAQVCALQFWLRLQQQDKTAFDDYYKICKVGGAKSFKEIVQLANLKVPFEDGCLQDVMKAIHQYLATIEDQKL